MSKRLPTKQITITIPDVKQTFWIYKHWFLLAIILGGTFLGGMYYQFKRNLNPNIERQRQGILTPAEIELLKYKEENNQLQSRIKTAEELLKEAKRNKDYQIDQSKNMIKKYDLEVDSLSEFYAELKGQTDKGTHKIILNEDDTSSFYWHDEYGRFKLFIPDLAKKYSIFEYDQHFKVNMVVFRQKPKDGALRVQTVHLYEITADGKTIIREADIDLKNSTFDFAIEEQKEQMSAHKWLVNLSNKGEVLVTYLPIHKYSGMFGAGLSAGFGANDRKFIGITVMGFPPSWYKSGFGVGASVGYDPNDKHVAWRLQVAWSFKDLIFK